MKPKHLILFLTCLSISFTAEAQLLRKLKKKAEIAAERTILNKTDEIVSKKTEQAIDSATTSKPKKSNNTKKETTKKSVPVPKQQTTNATGKESEADLHLLNKVDPYYTALGETVTFTIHIVNKGPASSNDIISKVHIPNSYSLSNISVTQGSYNEDTELWDIGNLEEWKKATMTIIVVVVDNIDLLTTAEVVSCSTKDPDSTPGNGIDTNGNGVIVDDKEDEDDGDGQDVVIGEVVAGNSNSNNSGNNSNNNNDNENSDNTNQLGGNNPNFIYYITTDIKLELKDGKDHIISYLDFDTMAMRMEYHGKRKNPDPVYWDQYGYIYSADKGQYVKVHFETFSNYMAQMLDAYTFFDPKAYLPYDNVSDELNYTIRTISYNSQEIIMSMGKYPIIEWAYYYHPSWFEGVEGVVKETISCRGSNNCKRYLVVSGQGKGTYIVFDSEDYLAEIVNPDGAKAIYTYEEAAVKLPNAVEYNFNTRN
jgi:uncharacterized repeat protein (TIGR01451 family)